MAKAATAHLKAYGFVETSMGHVIVGKSGKAKTRYVAVPGGFHRFENEDGVWRQYPYSIHPDWEGVGGLAFDAKQGATDPNSKVKPECFEWVYPDAEIAKVYGA